MTNETRFPFNEADLRRQAQRLRAQTLAGWLRNLRRRDDHTAQN